MHQICRPLELIWSDLWREKLFRIGIVIKIVLIIALMPTIQQEWFIPFIVNWIENPTTLPWSGHLVIWWGSVGLPLWGGSCLFSIYQPLLLAGL